MRNVVIRPRIGRNGNLQLLQEKVPTKVDLRVPARSRWSMNEVRKTYEKGKKDRSETSSAK
jgi:hypothetical protein